MRETSANKVAEREAARGTSVPVSFFVAISVKMLYSYREVSKNNHLRVETS